MKRHALLFWIGPCLYAVPTASVREIVPMAALTGAPGQPPLLHGFLNLRGTAVPVVSLRRLFGDAERDPHRYTPLVLIDADGQMIALEVDAVEQVIELDELTLEPFGADRSANDCARGIVPWEGRE